MPSPLAFLSRRALQLRLPQRRTGLKLPKQMMKLQRFEAKVPNRFSIIGKRQYLSQLLKEFRHCQHRPGIASQNGSGKHKHGGNLRCESFISDDRPDHIPHAENHDGEKQCDNDSAQQRAFVGDSEKQILLKHCQKIETVPRTLQLKMVFKWAENLISLSLISPARSAPIQTMPTWIRPASMPGSRKFL